MSNKVLAIIPARSGSKGIIDKNIVKIKNKPLIEYTIEQCLKSKLINRVIVSTDGNKIAEVSKKSGAEVPFKRPKEISGDLDTDFSCIEHCINWLKDNENYVPDIIVHLRCTTPIRDINEIDNAINYFKKKPNADSLRAIAPTCFNPYKMWTLDKKGWISPILKHEKFKEPYNQARQNLPKTFQQDGFIDIMRPSTIWNYKSITGNKILGYEIKERSIDIDTEKDIMVAKIELGRLNG
jgi:CMP-N,N'-diacetyllegionaminic acid synthase